MDVDRPHPTGTRGQHSGPADAADVQIVNNTVASSMSGIIVGGGDFYFTSAGTDDVRVHNNIVVDNQYGNSEQGTTGRGNTYKNNLVSGNTVVGFQLSKGLSDSATVDSAPLFAATARATGNRPLRTVRKLAGDRPRPDDVCASQRY